MYTDDKNYHIVTEFCGGGELFEHIICKGSFNELQASKVVKQILSAIKHLHDKNICHRDLKPENILFESKNFGLSKYFSPATHLNQDMMKTRTGTPYYMAPEVLEGLYDKACDMWSLGVIAYCLVSGYPPFNSDSDQKLFYKIKTCDYEFHSPEWDAISLSCKQFIEALLVRDPKSRLTPEQALLHPWITEHQQHREVARTFHILKRLAIFKRPNMFQKEILLLLAALLNSRELKDIRDTFSSIDLDSSGTITLHELREAFKENDCQYDLEEIISKVDFDENGEINYSEFISGTLDRTLLSKQNLKKVYFYLLQDSNEQVLTYQGLKQSFIRRGDFNKDRFNTMMREIGFSSNIDFKHFCELMGVVDI